MRWVVLLRGVNVNGVSVKSAPLAACLQDAGFTVVRTVLASGNVTFASEDGTSRDDVKARTEQALRAGFGYDAWVVVLTPDRLAEIVAQYPFARDDEQWHPYVVFASDPGRLAELFARHEANDAESVELAGDVAYWRCPKGSSTDTPFAKLSAAARWKPVVTTRNLRTVDKLLAAARP
ncbi:DUF1697 domain-containing protein [Kineococcus rhizosphaerae]|uniref:Uncharacterized protein (DUF1697 family) n=1 Tax=Kineococcus rhizosphaerae TaxID=559628 RepID=A0A2T0QUX6_9ACTN|nr:DUF1697 domain-containing protein [Kineococcus rhizosphaerae]PRY09087.1 uncharacterized protein (DUF1697 family) [Kineococcus rhizosphaerae]